VDIYGADGQRLSAVTNEEGRYEFSGLIEGQTYTVVVTSDSFTFAERVISISNSVVELDIVAE
jgi:hypothetical protein